MAFNQNIFATIASGGTVTSPFQVARVGDISIYAPVVTSGSVFLKGGFQNVTSTCVRVWKEDGSAAFSWPLGAGSAALTVSGLLGGFEYAAIETSAAQTDTRTFVVAVRV